MAVSRGEDGSALHSTAGTPRWMAEGKHETSFKHFDLHHGDGVNSRVISPSVKCSASRRPVMAPFSSMSLYFKHLRGIWQLIQCSLKMFKIAPPPHIVP